MTSFDNIQCITIWTGWDIRKRTKTSPQQLVCYMNQEQLPPTRADVVKETLKFSQVAEEEYGQKYNLVTYDLATAKIWLFSNCQNVFHD